METTTNKKSDIEVLRNYEELARKTIEIFVATATQAIERNNVFYVAISGGHTPQRFFELLAQSNNALELPWPEIELFWVDERYVPPESEYSNFKLAFDTFLNKVAIPKANIHRIPTEYHDMKIAAQTYAQTIQDIFGITEQQIPQFDLIILGMGVNGHTGSLFPDTFAPYASNELVCVVYMMDENKNRITLTHPVLRAASKLLVLVSGPEKADTLKAVLTSEPDEVRFPIHVLWPVLDKVKWLVDEDAAALI